jgi:cell division protein ZapA (FtsZ GTPase activity inhibitor)
MEKNKVVLNLAGQEFRISADRNIDYMKQLEAEVNRRVREISEQYPLESTARCTLLAMLNLADEACRLHEQNADVEVKFAELRTLREPREASVKAPVKRPFERAKKPEGRQPEGVR